MADSRTGLQPGKREDEIKMMSDPMLWPHLALPIKRSPNGVTECGVLLGYENYLTHVFLVNLFMADVAYEAIQRMHKGEPAGIEFIKYDSYEAIFDDGWRVD